MGQVQPQFQALQRFAVAADQFIGLGGFLPDHLFEWIATPVGAHTVVFAAAQVARTHGAARYLRLPRRQGRRVGLGLGVDEYARRRAPDGPDPERAQRKARFCRQRGQRLAPAPGGREGHLHARAALRRHIGQAPVFGTQHGQPDAMAHAAPCAAECDANCDASPRKCWLWRYQMHSKSTQRAVAHVHAHHGAARQQKGQHIAQVELVVDGSHQQHQQGQP